MAADGNAAEAAQGTEDSKALAAVKSIIVGYEGSDAAERALAHAGQIAEALSTRLVVVSTSSFTGRTGDMETGRRRTRLLLTGARSRGHRIALNPRQR